MWSRNASSGYNKGAMRIGTMIVLSLIAPTVTGSETRDTSRRSVAVPPSKFRKLGEVRAGSVSFLDPSGRYAMRYSANDAILVSLSGSRAEETLQGHVQNIHDAGWSRNGKVVATAGFDGLVKLWEVETLREISSIEAHTGYA